MVAPMREVETVPHSYAEELRRRNADDLHKIVIREQLDAGGQIASAQFALPIRVTGNGGRSRAGALILRSQQTPAERPDAQHAKELAAYQNLVEVPHLAATADVALVRAPGECPREGLLFVSDQLPERARQLSILLIHAHAAVTAYDFHFGEFLRVLDRQAAQADGVEQLKNGCVGADSQRQRDDSHGRESGTQARRAQAVAQILPGALQPGNGVHAVNLLSHQSGIAKLAARGRGSLGGRHAARDVVGGFGFQIRRDLARTFFVPPPPLEEPPPAHVRLTPPPAAALG